MQGRVATRGGGTPPPRSIFMAPAVGGVAHGSVNALALAERARTAHRQKKVLEEVKKT